MAVKHRVERRAGLLAALLGLAIAGTLGAQETPGSTPPPSAPELEQRAVALKGVSEHLICQCGCNMILSECSHQSCPFALPERREIVSALARGVGEDEIVAGYVAEYGPSIRSTPPTEGSLFDRFAWFAPYLALAAGTVALVAFLVSSRRATVPAQAAPAAGSGAALAEDPYVRRVEEEVGGQGSAGAPR